MLRYPGGPSEIRKGLLEKPEVLETQKDLKVPMAIFEDGM